MNSITERDHKLAEVLKWLSLEPSAHQVEAPRLIPRRLLIVASLLVLITLSILAIVYYPPEMLGRIKTVRSSQQDERGDADISVEKTGLPSDRVSAQTREVSTDRGALAVDREITGSGYVVAPRVTSIYAKYAGRIDMIAVDVGDHVDAGQALIRLDDADTRFALEQAKSDRAAADLQRAVAEIDLAQARASLARIKPLAAGYAVSLQQLDEAGSATERAANVVAQAQQNIAKAALAVRIAAERVDELMVRAPFAGTVTRLGAHVGDSVLAREDSVRENQSLLTITDTQNMVIDAEVAETNIALLRPGLQGEAVLDAFPGRPFAIKVVRLAPAVSVEKGTITLRLSLTAQPAGIRPNMAARIRIRIQTRIPVVDADGTPLPQGEIAQ